MARGTICARDVTVVGVDVGGLRKGFHAVALRGGRFVDAKAINAPADVADWCMTHAAHFVAVDAPCGWSESGSSRLSERDLNIGGQTIQCFKTPTRERALKNVSGFYGWVFNGEQLYRELVKRYSLFDGQRVDGHAVFETFPHAIVCALSGKVVTAKPKATTRRRTLCDQGYDDSVLPNIDFVDAGLCALAAKAFRDDRWQCFGNQQEGFIVVPRISLREASVGSHGTN
jgi:predicted nuclease with RNAse H fold